MLRSRLRRIPFLIDTWCPLFPSNQLKTGHAKAEVLLDARIVVYRGEDGVVRALEDRCPHRGVALSLGRVKGNCMQCAYHGWIVGGDGIAVSAPGIGTLVNAPSVRCIPVREHAGLIWAFLGDTARLAAVSLPNLAPYGTAQSVDLCIITQNETHWSLLFDNGMDLFHGHLHQGVPYFFEIDSLECYGVRDDTFEVMYRGSVGAGFGTKRKGNVVITLTGISSVRFDFDGMPVLSVAATPRSLDGTQLTTWYLFSFPLPLYKRIFVRSWLPFIRNALKRGFLQDSVVLASELRAMREGLAVQNEVNPMLLAAHEYVTHTLAERALAGIIACGRPTIHPRDKLIGECHRGTLLVISIVDNRPLLLIPEELEAVLPHSELVEATSYMHCHLVGHRKDQIQPKYGNQ